MTSGGWEQDDDGARSRASATVPPGTLLTGIPDTSGPRTGSPRRAAWRVLVHLPGALWRRLLSWGERAIRRFGEVNPSGAVAWDAVVPFVERAVAAYGSDAEIMAAYPGAFVHTNEGLELKVFVQADADAQWIAVRGTANLENGFEDMEYHPDPDHRLGIVLHAGFHRASHAIYDEIVARLVKDRPVRITGHSLGGAIAVILEAFLIVDGFHVEQCVTIGQPKLTNRAGAQKLQTNPLLRLVNDEDPVPLVPPITLEAIRHGAYHHFGPEAILLPHGSFIFLREHDASRMLVSSLWANLSWINVKMHSSHLYRERVEAIVARLARATAGSE